MCGNYLSENPKKAIQLKAWTEYLSFCSHEHLKQLVNASEDICQIIQEKTQLLGCLDLSGYYCADNLQWKMNEPQSKEYDF